VINGIASSGVLFIMRRTLEGLKEVIIRKILQMWCLPTFMPTIAVVVSERILGTGYDLVFHNIP
jgi:hypothetical protein